jgi:hypothetical protein
MGGHGYSYGFGKLDAWIVRTDNLGNMVWDKSYGGKQVDTCWSMEMTDDDKYVICVTMNFQGIAGDKSDTHLVKLDDDGNVEWVQIFGGPGQEIGISVRQTDDGGFIVAGRNGVSYSSRSDALLVKFAPFENQRPNQPDKPSGPAKGRPDTEYTFSTTPTTDPDGDQVSYRWDWGDGNFTDGTNEESYTWATKDNFEVRVKAVDENGGESEWSEPLPFSTPKTKYTTLYQLILWRLIERFPLLEQLV